MTELPPDVEQRIADMSPEDFDLLVARCRPPEEESDPKARAVAALRRSRGLDRTSKASREAAVAALRAYSDQNTRRSR